MVATAANSTDTTPVTAAPRNAQQVRNTQKRERNKQRLSRAKCRLPWPKLRFRFRPDVRDRQTDDDGHLSNASYTRQ